MSETTTLLFEIETSQALEELNALEVKTNALVAGLETAANRFDALFRDSERYSFAAPETPETKIRHAEVPERSNNETVSRPKDGDDDRNETGRKTNTVETTEKAAREPLPPRTVPNPPRNEEPPVPKRSDEPPLLRTEPIRADRNIPPEREPERETRESRTVESNRLESPYSFERLQTAMEKTLDAMFGPILKPDRAADNADTAPKPILKPDRAADNADSLSKPILKPDRAADNADTAPGLAKVKRVLYDGTDEEPRERRPVRENPPEAREIPFREPYEKTTMPAPVQSEPHESRETQKTQGGERAVNSLSLLVDRLLTAANKTSGNNTGSEHAEAEKPRASTFETLENAGATDSLLKEMCKLLEKQSADQSRLWETTNDYLNRLVARSSESYVLTVDE